MSTEPSWAQRPWEEKDTTAGPANGGTPPPEAKGGTGWGCLGIVVAIIALAVSCSVIGGGTDGGGAPTSYEAERQCQDWIRDQLLAPSSAQFSETSSVGGPASWTVNGMVDAENGFGAMLRSAWTCDIRLDGDMWRGTATLLE